MRLLKLQYKHGIIGKSYKNFFISVERVEEAIDVALKVNPDAIIISNFWYSIKPTIVSLVSLLTGHN